VVRACGSEVLGFLFFVFLRWRAQKTKNNEEEKYHSAEG
jgi:hypothetical protein